MGLLHVPGQDDYIKLRNEVDRFGFSYLLSLLFGNKSISPSRCWCTWQHGWKWYPALDFRHHIIGPNKIKIKTHIVNKFADYMHLKYVHGFERVQYGGLPFAYAFNNINKLNTFVGSLVPIFPSIYDTCVFLPKCSFEVESAKSLISQIYDSLDLRSRCLFVVFYEDLRNSSLIDTLNLYGASYVCGSSPGYKYDLIRTVQLLKQFKFMITNSLGSHIAYSASMGHKIMLSSMQRHRSIDEFARQNWSKYFDKDSLERFAHYNSYKFFLNHYSCLFELDKFSQDLSQWGRYQIGAQRLLSDNQILNYLGWTTNGLINNLARATRFRLSFFKA